jgi:3-oxoacyl-[acyl-carrier protein] reductase
LEISLIGKTSLVTGGARGLGKSFVESLSDSGSFVYFTSRNQDLIRTLETELNSGVQKVKGIHVDVTSNESKEIISTVLNDDNRAIDILINNVGDTMKVGAFESNMNKWQDAINLNFLTHVDLINYFLVKMKENNWGRIVNITSIAGLEVSGPPAFNVAKAALTSYTRSVGRLLAIENPGVVMTAVAPGIIATKDGHWEQMEKTDPVHVKNYMESRAALKRFGTESEISGIVTFLSSELASFFHGAIIQVDGGQSRSYMPHTYL